MDVAEGQRGRSRRNSPFAFPCFGPYQGVPTVHTSWPPEGANLTTNRDRAVFLPENHRHFAHHGLGPTLHTGAGHEIHHTTARVGAWARAYWVERQGV